MIDGGVYLGAFPWNGGVCQVRPCRGRVVAVCVVAHLEQGGVSTYHLCRPCVVVADRHLRDLEPAPPPVSEAKLRRLYRTMGVRAIARKLGHGRTTVRHWFEFYGIESRSPEAGRRLAAAP